MTVFLDVVPCSFIVRLCFRGTGSHHHQGGLLICKTISCHIPEDSNIHNGKNPISNIMYLIYEGYSKSKYCFAIKKISSEVSYKILSSDSTFFKLFFHVFCCHY